MGLRLLLLQEEEAEAAEHQDQPQRQQKDEDKQQGDFYSIAVAAERLLKHQAPVQVFIRQ